MMKKMKKLSAVIIASSIGMAASSAFAQEADIGGQTQAQALGYIGEVSKSTIQSGQLYRLQAGDVSANFFTTNAVDDLAARVKFWHEVALDSVALDHTPPAEGVPSPLNQGGPTRTSRALAMVQVAVFDALNAFDGSYNSYSIDVIPPAGASDHAAVAAAAYKMLKHLYPAQQDRLQAIFDEDKARIKTFTSSKEFNDGKKVGEKIFKEIRDDRKADGSRRAEPGFGEGGAVADGNTTFFGTPINGGTTLVGEWEPDPNTPAAEADLALGAYWGAVSPFFMAAGDQFRIPEPPLPGSPEFQAAYAGVAAVGGAPDNVNTVSTGTDDTRFVGNYWGYDGVPLIGVPPRIYNQIAIQITKAEGTTDPLEIARALAMVNIGMADVAIAAWDSKFYYNFWRPVTGIRRDDGDAATIQDPTWNPVGVSVINTTNPVRVTPPFPAYPSGHAAFGGVTFEVLRELFGDDTPFTFVSDEYNGEGFDPFHPDVPRPFVPVRFERLTDAQEQNGISRVYNGVHWSFDDAAGQAQGVNVGRYLLEDVTAFKLK